MGFLRFPKKNVFKQHDMEHFFRHVKLMIRCKPGVFSHFSLSSQVTSSTKKCSQTLWHKARKMQELNNRIAENWRHIYFLGLQLLISEPTFPKMSEHFGHFASFLEGLGLGPLRTHVRCFHCIVRTKKKSKIEIGWTSRHQNWQEVKVLVTVTESM